MNIDRSRFKRVELLFGELRRNPRNTSPLNEIERVLNDQFRARFSLNIINPLPNAPLCIMSVYPEVNTVSRIVDAIIKEESDTVVGALWRQNTEWVIEIDYRVLEGKDIFFTDSELTALLLHEIGHTVYSNSIPQRVTKILKYEYANFSMGLKELFSKGGFKQMLELPIYRECRFDSYSSKERLKHELKADLFAVKNGYGLDLESALNKMTDYAATKNILGNDMETDTKMSASLVNAMARRKVNVSRSNFNKMMLDTPSTFIRNALSGISKNVYKESVESGVDSVALSAMAETANRIYENAYYREAFELFRKKLKRIDPFTIDYIKVRINEMKNNDDKLMILSYIRNKLDLIDYYIGLMDTGNNQYIFTNNRNELLNMKAALLKLRKDVLDYRIPETKYGVQIVYPDGYLG